MTKRFCGRNYFLLALAIVYCIIAGIQSCVDGILSTQFYVSIAFISVSTTICEFLKSAIKWCYALDAQLFDAYTMTQRNMKRHIEIFGRFSFFTELVEQYEKESAKMEKPQESNLKKYKEKVLGFLESVIPFIEAFLIIYFSLISPLKKIPNNVETAKIINISSILSVALAFWSIYLNESTSAIIERNERKLKDYFRASDYYLNIIETISANQARKEETTVDSEKGGEL